MRIEMEDKSVIDTINDGLSKYYKICSRDDYFNEDNGQNGIFKFFCIENGYDDDGVLDELAQGEEICLFCDQDQGFDTEFPFIGDRNRKIAENDQKAKQKMIYDILKKCQQGGDAMVLFNFTSFEITPEHWKYEEKEELQKTLKIYKQQLDTSGHLYYGMYDALKDNTSLVKLLTIGRLSGQKYFQLLLDTYLRDRHHTQKSSGIAVDITKWARVENKYMMQLKGDRDYPQHATEIIIDALKAWRRNVCPLLMMSHIIQINDSLKEVSMYILSIIEYIYKIAKEQASSFPFQADHCFIFDKIRHREPKRLGFANADSDEYNDSDEDDDDEFTDEDSDDGHRFFDCVGDIEKRLGHEGLIFNKTKVYGINSSIFEQQFNEFKDMISRKYKGDEFIKYPQRKRFICVIDRRKPRKDRDFIVSVFDEMIFCKPPNICETIPDNHVPEWYFEASKTCIIPNIGFSMERKFGNSERKRVRLIVDGYIRECERLLQMNKINSIIPDGINQICFQYYPIYKEISSREYVYDDKKKLRSRVIDSTFHCKGALILLSFHVEAIDEIKVYLSWNGQMTRFMPQDIIDILPEFFEGSKENRDWVKSEDAKEMVQKMSEKLRDSKFESFYKQYGSKRK